LENPRQFAAAIGDGVCFMVLFSAVSPPFPNARFFTLGEFLGLYKPAIHRWAGVFLGDGMEIKGRAC
jgi:hypothetical protein